MKHNPLVSIVTPSYNQVAFLESTLLSVIKQSYPHIEYFVVDGGSTDGSAEIIADYSKQPNSRIKWWVSEKDQGQAEAINKGLKRAAGEIIGWLNSDDLYLKDTVEKVVRIFETVPQLGMVFSNVMSIDSDDDIINQMCYRNWGLEDLMAFNIIGQPGVFFRRSVLQKTGYLDERFHCLLDHHLWLRIALNSEISYLDDCLAAARFHSQAKNIAQSSLFSDEAFLLLDWIKSTPKYRDIYLDNKNKIDAGTYRFSARYLLDAGLYARAIKNYLKSLWIHPPTALKELHRIGYAFFSLIMPMDRIKQVYLNHKKKRTNRGGTHVIDKWWMNE